MLKFLFSLKITTDGTSIEWLTKVESFGGPLGNKDVINFALLCGM